MRRQTVELIVMLVALAVSACTGRAAPSSDASGALRQDALARATVFVANTDTSVLAARATTQPGLECRFLVTEPTGTTPKFDCELPDGSSVKVKYGRTPEVAGEAAATRLLTALGFAADRVTLVERVRCYGCPVSPFHVRRVARWISLEGVVRRTRDYSEFRDFEWVAVERKLDGVALEGNEPGWTFIELAAIDASRGGASDADVDALRLMAVFLAHWDNKSANQRLLCLPPAAEGDACARPVVMLQDVGATFGPPKVDLAAWRATPIWSDPEECRVSMMDLPYQGATFVDVQISEAGRRALADRLVKLTPSQIERLFREAHFPGDVTEWVRTFQWKVEQITRRPPCPA